MKKKKIRKIQELTLYDNISIMNDSVRYVLNKGEQRNITSTQHLIDLLNTNWTSQYHYNEKTNN